MARSTRKLDELAELLERTGGDAQRLGAVKCAQKFRRSWIDLAQSLVKIRSSRAYQRWGYEDFHEYCSKELTLKRPTVDKLTISYSTLERHKPEVLQRDGVAKSIPSYQAIDYFSKVVDKDEGAANETANKRARGRKAPPRGEELEALSSAVFDEGKPVGELRKRFDPVFFPRPKGSEELDQLRKADSASRRLAEQLAEVSVLQEDDAAAAAIEALGALRERLAELIEPLEKKVNGGKKRTRAPRMKSASGDA